MTAPGWVRATGRRVAAESAPAKWIGLKAHARKVSLAADLEMHFFPDGYVGLCRLPAGEVNVCGLFALRQPIPQLAAQWPEILSGPAGSGLRERLRTAEFDHASFSAVSALDLTPTAGQPTDECSIGDALTMIPPVTGNGMSMAFESAHWAAAPLAAYSRGELAWAATRQTIARQCANGFAGRLRWAAWFQRQLMHAGRRELLLRVGNGSDWLWRLCFAKTR
jgi:2-polyprenyl-6-methoxyphenol hydroxylase-like FAD-dependent oxidoreductase